MIAPTWARADRLRLLLQDFAVVSLQQNRKISGLQLDSRQLQKGDVFIALPGAHVDGAEFIPQALKVGVAAIVYETCLSDDVLQQQAQEAGVPLIQLNGLAGKLGEISARYYGHPSRNMTVIGVTGTDGKTSVSHFIAQAIKALGQQSAVIGTIGNGLLGKECPATHTTPNAIELQSLLDEMREQGVNSVSMEVSSHGLHQGRVRGVEFDIAVLTNLGRDHMDYHKSMHAYADAKRALFYMRSLRAAVLNCDDDFGCMLALELEDAVPVYGYGFGDDMQPNMVARIKGSDLRLSPRGLRFSVACGGQKFDLNSPLLGHFNANNLLAVVTSLMVLGLPLSEAVELAHRLKAVPGRMQLIERDHAANVVVDYAHTPQALEAALSSLREHLQEGHLICVFGCGGDRDKGKRSLMGAVAARYADKLIVTSDNPRKEQPQAIADDILEGISGQGEVVVELDRAQAIRIALDYADEHDVVLIAGKGHEDYQIIGDDRFEFSDVVEVARYSKSSDEVQV